MLSYLIRRHAPISDTSKVSAALIILRILSQILLNDMVLQLLTPVDIFSLWTEHLTMGLLHVKFLFSTRISYRGVLYFATDCPCSVWCLGLTTCLLVVNSFTGKLVLKSSWSLNLTKKNNISHYICFCLYIYASWYINTLFSFDLFSRFHLNFHFR